MRSSALANSESFIKALRATSDPPEQGLPPKIDLASAAWHDSDFYVPAKAQLIAEWLLTALSKAREQIQSPTPLLDERYWRLLHEVAANPQGPTSQTPRWLGILSSRFHIVSLVTASLKACASLPEGVTPQFAIEFRRVLNIFWPNASQRSSFDVLYEAFVSCVHTLTESSPPDLLEVTSVVADSVNKALEKFSSVKKHRAKFMNDSIGIWFRICFQGPSDSKLVSESWHNTINSFRKAGLELIFQLDLDNNSNGASTLVSILVELKNITCIPPHVLYQSIPEMLRHNLQLVKRHKLWQSDPSSSKPTSMNRESRLSAVLDVFISEFLFLLGDGSAKAVAWTAWLKMLIIMESEIRQMSLNLQVLSSVLPPVCQVLRKTVDSETRHIALECVATIARIDYGLILSHERDIIEALLDDQKLNSSSRSQFMDLCLTYHCKTRTLYDFLEVLFKCIQTYDGPNTEWNSVSGGTSEESPLHHTFQRSLLQAISSFLTPGQCLRALRLIFEITSGSYRSWHDASSYLSQLHGTVSRLIRLVSGIMTAFPLPLLSGDEEEEAISIVKAFSLILQTRPEKKRGKRAGEDIVTAAIFYFHSTLQSAPMGRKWALLCPELIGPMLEWGFSRLSQGLVFYDFARFYFQNYSTRPEYFPKVLDTIESYLRYPDQSTNEAVTLTDERAVAKASVLSLCILLIERWLPVFDTQLSGEECQAVTRLLITLWEQKPAGLSDTHRGKGVPYELLRMASIWETKILKAAFISFAVEQFCLLLPEPSSSEDDHLTRMSLSYSPKLVQELHTKNAVGFIDILCEIPPQCLLKEHRIRVLESALRIEALLGKHSMQTPESLDQVRASLRTLLSHIIGLGCSWKGLTGDLLIHLTEKQSFTDTMSEQLLASTAQLLRTIVDELKSAPAENSRVSLLRYLDRVIGAVPQEFTDRARLWMQELQLLTETLNESEVLQPLDDNREICLQKTFLNLHSLMRSPPLHNRTHYLPDWYSAAFHLFAAIYSSLARLFKNEKLVDELKALTFIDIIRSLSQLGYIQQIICQKSALDLVITRVAFVSGPDHQEIDCLIALVIVADKTGNIDDEWLLRKLNGLPIQVYIDLSQRIAKALEGVLLGADTFGGILRLSGVLLRTNHSASASSSWTHLKSVLLTVRAKSLQETAMSEKLRILGWLESACLHKWALLNIPALGNIWAILFQFTQGSEKHSESTNPRILEMILTVLASLVRSRRDLIVATIPQLVSITKRLFRILSAPRADLGKRQRHLVGATLPWWINPSHPLGEKEARAVGRYLTTFKTKTASRVVGNGIEAKAESLARPLSIHAPAILSAYVKTMHEPLNFLSSRVRRELEPGLFILCDITSTHARDATMTELTDAAEKAAFKQLWQEYEKQKYVGQG